MCVYVYARVCPIQSHSHLSRYIYIYNICINLSNTVPIRNKWSEWKNEIEQEKRFHPNPYARIQPQQPFLSQYMHTITSTEISATAAPTEPKFNRNQHFLSSSSLKSSPSLLSSAAENTKIHRHTDTFIVRKTANLWKIVEILKSVRTCVYVYCWCCWTVFVCESIRIIQCVFSIGWVSVWVYFVPVRRIYGNKCYIDLSQKGKYHHTTTRHRKEIAHTHTHTRLRIYKKNNIKEIKENKRIGGISICICVYIIISGLES